MKSVQKILTEHGLPFEVKEFSEKQTLGELSKTLGCATGQIVKSMIFKTKFTGIPILMILSGANYINEKEMRKRFCEKLVLADEEFILTLTGFSIEAIPPFAHLSQIDQVYIDKDLQQWDTLWISAGVVNTYLHIPTKHLIKLSKGKVISIT